MAVDHLGGVLLEGDSAAATGAGGGDEDPALRKALQQRYAVRSGALNSFCAVLIFFFFYFPELGQVKHDAEGEIVCRLTNAMIPYFNAGVYLENKAKIGKVEEVFGPVNKVYFTIKTDPGVQASSFKAGDVVFIGTDKLLPLSRFTNEAKGGGGRGGGRGGSGGRGGPPGRGSGRGGPGRAPGGRGPPRGGGGGFRGTGFSARGGGGRSFSGRGRF